MIHFDFFTGGMGFSLAAHAAGMHTLVTCDNNVFAKRCIDYYMPWSDHTDDIHLFDYAQTNARLIQQYGCNWRNQHIVLTGGFPCQPFSLAGKGKSSADSRHLWPEMSRAIREVAPTFVLGENVPGIINRENGMVLSGIQSDLEDQGFEVALFDVPAACTQAPHRRERVIIFGYSEHNGRIAAENIRRIKESSRERGQIPSGQSSGTDSHCWAAINAIRASAQNHHPGRGDKAGHALERHELGFFGKEISDQFGRPIIDVTYGQEIAGERSQRHQAQGYGENGVVELPANASNGGGLNGNISVQQWRQDQAKDPDTARAVGDGVAAESVCSRCQEPDYAQITKIKGLSCWSPSSDQFSWFPSVKPFLLPNDGLSHLLAIDAVSSLKKRRITTPEDALVRWNTCAIECMGNAIVPQQFFPFLMNMHELVPLIDDQVCSL